MAVISCGKTPSSSCGSYNDSSNSELFYFTTSNDNPLLLSKKEVHGTCYSASRYYNASNDPYGLMATALAATGQWSSSRRWTLYPFHIEVKGRIDFTYNSSGELIVTLNDVVSTLTGTAGDIGRTFQAYLYTAGYFGWGVTAKLVNASNPTAVSSKDRGWHKCMGGWWSAAPTRDCSSHCPGGGTLYWWNAWNRFGTPYETHGNTPTRTNSGISWNLGVPNTQTQLIGLFARATRGTCSNAYFSSADGDFQQCIFIQIPPMNLCPPEINGITYERDICEETVDTVINVTTPTLGTDGVNLVIMYEAINNESEWSNGKATTYTVYNVAENSTFDVALPQNLIPDTNYYFKIHLEKDGRKSDEIMVCDQRTPYMPSATCLVPLFTEEECAILAGGDCLDELTAENMEVCC